MSELTEEELAAKAEKFATDLAAMLNQAREDGLLVLLDTNEHDAHSVGYGVGPGLAKWISVYRSGEDGNGPYEVTR